MLSFADWIEAVRFRWKLVALVTFVLTLIALLYVIIAPRSYQASSSLLLDTRAADPLRDNKSDDSKDNAREIIATQADLIRSPSVSDLAAANAGVNRDPNVIAKWKKETDGDKPFDGWMRERMLKSLDVVPGKDSNILVIQVKSKDPVEAARIANGFATASVASQYRLRTQPAKNYAVWLEQRLGTAKNNVIQSQNALSSFVRATGITNDGDMSSEGTQMAEVATQLATAEARAAAARQSTFAGAQSRGDAEKSVSIQELRKQVAVTSGTLSNMRATFGPDYPDVKRTEAELNTLQGQLTKQLSSTTGAFGAARSGEASAERGAAGASEARLRSLASQQRARVEKMGVNLAEYGRLKNEFVASQKNFNDLNDRLERMRLQGNVPQTEVQILDRASPPLEPTWPKPGLIIALTILLGLILGAIWAIVLEALDPRVRSWSGLERLLGAPVLATLTLPRDGPLLLERGHA
ncbi:GumC family protein [Sphingomonas sp. RB1R13]|uniref:GumC family protein n=1 Tax=Sphingomonas sp. RB1R13 TaxID=3096159 RepID=UPI002FCA8A3F